MTGNKLKIDIRRRKILEQLRLDGKVSVSRLSEMLHVTPVTIRNDLAILEQENCLMRVQGGAVHIPDTGRDYPGLPQNDIFEQEKKNIGAAIARMIRDGDTLFLNSGTTCEHVAAALSIRRNLNVVTNSVQVALRLGAIQSFRVLLIGGEINSRYGFTHGGDAQEQLSKYQADWAILAVDGISARGGVTTLHAEEAVIDRMMYSGAKQTVVAADSSKIGRTGFSRVCECARKLLLVTNEGGDAEALAQLRQSGVNVVEVK